MLNKDEVLKARDEGRIDVEPWRPENISDDGTITLHLANGVELKSALQGEVQVEGKTEEIVRISHYPFNIRMDLKGYLEPEEKESYWVDTTTGRPARGVEILISPRTIVIPGHNGPIRIPMLNRGTESFPMKKGTPVVKIYFEPLYD